MMEKKTDAKKLALSAVMIALSAGLSMIRIIQLPFGGSVTLFGMLPVCMISIMYGARWGVFNAFVYSLVQLALDAGAVAGWGLTPQALVGAVIFDYIAAFSVLGLAGLFRASGIPGVLGGIALAIGLRVACHIVSGVIFFASLAPDGRNPFIYAVCYNAAHMIPEAVLTLVGAVILLKEPHTSKLFRVYRKPPEH